MPLPPYPHQKEARTEGGFYCSKKFVDMRPERAKLPIYVTNKSIKKEDFDRIHAIQKMMKICHQKTSILSLDGSRKIIPSRPTLPPLGCFVDEDRVQSIENRADHVSAVPKLRLSDATHQSHPAY